MKKTILERIQEKYTVGDSGCWEWTACRDQNGYGRIGIRSDGVSVNRHAHVVAFEIFIGPTPVGMELDHTCRNRACINPAHLEPVTHRENVLRGIAPSAICAKATHCSKGHPFSPENTHHSKTAGRTCKICRRARYHNNKEQWIERASATYYKNRNKILKRLRDQYKAKKEAA